MVRFSERTTQATADKEDESKNLGYCLISQSFNKAYFTKKIQTLKKSYNVWQFRDQPILTSATTGQAAYLHQL